MSFKNPEDNIEIKHTEIPKDFVLFKDNTYYFKPNMKSHLGTFHI
jgi:hypothetical protein